MDNVTSPRVLGNRYEVSDMLGRGGMAEVHLGRDTRLGRVVAVKILRADLARDPVFQARFRREAQSAASLNHPAIVAVYDTGEEHSVDAAGNLLALPYIVMEYVSGRTLRDMLQEGNPLPTPEALEITSGVLSALEYSHRAGIVHRDIKPANVMVTPAGDVKVMDFGIARALADSSATMTQTQAVIGTAQYLSPEQARGETVDARSDLYSAGCLLFELLTARPPFVGDSPVSVAYQHVREAPVAPSTINSELSADVDAVVLHSLAKDREDRYQNAAEFRADVERLRRGQQVQVASPNAATAAIPTAAATEYIPGGAAAAATQALPQNTAGSGTPTGYAQPIPPQRGGNRSFAVLLGLLLVIIAAAIGFFAYTKTEEQKYRTLPSLDGMKQEQAVAELGKLGLNPVIKHKESLRPVNTVIDQDPKPGRINTDDLPGGRDIKITLSAGPGTVEVPDVSGLTQSEALKRLQAKGLTIGDNQDVDDPNVAKNRVIRTEPAAGKNARKGEPVKLFISSGEVVVPDLMNKTYGEAQQELQKVGLKATVDQATPNPEGKASWIVTNQDKKQGERVKQKSAVVLSLRDPAVTTNPTDPNASSTSPGATDGTTPATGSSPAETPPPAEGQALKQIKKPAKAA